MCAHLHSYCLHTSTLKIEFISHVFSQKSLISQIFGALCVLCIISFRANHFVSLFHTLISLPLNGNTITLSLFAPLIFLVQKLLYFFATFHKQKGQYGTSSSSQSTQCDYNVVSARHFIVRWVVMTIKRCWYGPTHGMIQENELVFKRPSIGTQQCMTCLPSKSFGYVCSSLQLVITLFPHRFCIRPQFTQSCQNTRVVMKKVLLCS